MGLQKVLFISVSAIVVLLGMKVYSIFRIPPVPILPNTWWGPGDARLPDTSINPFQISVPDEVLKDLQVRLNRTRLTAPLEGIQQQYGFNTNTLKEVLNYWAKKYNWRQREQYLNQFKQFKTNIQGLNIHYIHMKPSQVPEEQVFPLLLLHGWPGSVREFYKLIPIMTKLHKEYKFAFEVIVPSLPGYAFSDAAVRPGLGAAQIAVVFKNLMARIGHEKFYVQGGDFGSIIVKNMAILFPDRILGLHTNMGITSGPKSLLKLLVGSIYPPLVVSKEHEHKMYPLKARFEDLLYETGYLHLQATKPDSLGVGLNDSPAGLAAYILEKFSTATNASYRQREDAGLLDKFTYDELIDNIMLYWITGSFTSACRLYAETFSKNQFSLDLEKIPINEKVPCAAARLPYEIVYLPDDILRDKFTTLVQTTDFKEGGHFAAFEVPELLAEDIFSAVSKILKLNNREIK